jgi:hypothetical protein
LIGVVEHCSHCHPRCSATARGALHFGAGAGDSTLFFERLACLRFELVAKYSPHPHPDDKKESIRAAEQLDRRHVLSARDYEKKKMGESLRKKENSEKRIVTVATWRATLQLCREFRR